MRACGGLGSNFVMRTPIHVDRRPAGLGQLEFVYQCPEEDPALFGA